MQRKLTQCRLFLFSKPTHFYPISCHQKKFFHIESQPSVLSAFVGYKEKGYFSIESCQKIKVKFSYGRGMFDLEIFEGKVKTGGVDITHLLPEDIIRSKKFELTINDGVKINDLNVTEIVTNSSNHVSNNFKF